MYRIMIILIMVGLLLIVSNLAWSKTIYVKSGGSGDGSSWANAYGDLQDGLDAADPNDEIWVAAGTYKPTSDYGWSIGDRGKHFRMKNRVAIYGGFPASGDPVWPDRDLNTHETILSGDLLGNDVEITDPLDSIDDPSREDNCYHVFYHPSGINLDPNAVLNGFTVTGGYTDQGEGSSGSGMYNYQSSPTIIHCIFSGNFCARYTFGGPGFPSRGGGMYNYESSPVVAHCTFNGNMADAGGGMCNWRESPTMVTHCTFSGNTSSWGGGVASNDSDLKATYCKFLDNVASYCGEGCDGRGGGLSFSGGRLILSHSTFIGNETNSSAGGISTNHISQDSLISNCIFSGNSTPNGGGGMTDGSDGALTVINCTFTGNSASYGGGMYIDSGSPIVINCVLWGNTGDPQISKDDDSSETVIYSDVQGGYPGTGNIDADPMFKDPNGPDNILGTADDNLQLAYNSPCIDAGDNTAVPADTADLDGDGDTSERIPLDLAGHARFTDDPLTVDTGVADPPDYPAVVDMGAYERYEFCGDPSQALKGDLNLDCYIDLLDFGILCCNWLNYVGPE